MTALTLAAAYPCAKRGAERMAAYTAFTTAEEAAFYATADEHALAEMFTELGDLHRLLFDRAYKLLDRSVRDRWLTAGDDRFARAVRAHGRHQGAEARAALEAFPLVTALVPASQWKKQLAELEAHTVATLREAETRLQEAQALHEERSALLAKLRARLADGVLAYPALGEG